MLFHRERLHHGKTGNMPRNIDVQDIEKSCELLIECIRKCKMQGYPLVLILFLFIPLFAQCTVSNDATADKYYTDVSRIKAGEQAETKVENSENKGITWEEVHGKFENVNKQKSDMSIESVFWN